MSKEVVKPFLKWIGGKTQILEHVLSYFPREINNYYEIFLGGGSVLFGLLSYIKLKNIKVLGKIYAYDINEPLIYLYKNIQTNHLELIKQVEDLTHILNSIDEDFKINRNPNDLDEALSSKESFYYWIRKQYNNQTDEEKKTVLGSTFFLFLNKTCFRGLFRVGPNGFNVPYGNYKNPQVIDKKHIILITNLIKDVEFNVLDFENSIDIIQQNVCENDFIYLDPPYAPETKNSFVKYTDKGFDLKNHKKLFTLCNELVSDFNLSILLSNANVSLVRDYFTNDLFYIEEILCKRSINSKKPGSKTIELLIKSNNY
jgi:DNA adenine methylase